MILLQNVTVCKSGRHLFQDFSLAINAGEHWVIQGPNGSGKTTLLQLIAGALTPLLGKIYHSFIASDDWDTLYRVRLV